MGGYKRWRFANDTLDRITSIILVIVLLIGIYSVIDSLYLFRNPGSDLAYFFEGGKEEWDKLPDNAVAWLTIDDTNIDYPVMQGKDNDEYLNKDAFGQYSLVGSIFMDWRNDPDWKDDYNLLYGHHMSTKKMFGSLDEYKEKKFFKKHKTGTLKTRGADYSLTIFAVLRTTSEEHAVFNCGPDEEANVREFIKAHSLYYEEPKEDKILAMSTCQDAGTTERLIVFASMKKTREPGTLYDTDNLVEP